MFRQLSLRGWRQYRRIDIDFHPRLTLLTGANGAGKTTLLSIVTRHIGWGTTYVSTPSRDGSDSTLLYIGDLWDFDGEDYVAKHGPPRPLNLVRHQGNQTGVGTIVYENGAIAQLSIPTAVGATYDLNITNQQGIEGIYIPSHRPTYAYQAVSTIPTAPRNRNEVYNQYSHLLRVRHSGGHTPQSPHYYMKETLIGLATFGYGNQAVRPNSNSIRLFERFQDILRLVLPRSLGFRRLSVQVPEIILETETGDFSIDAVSGGIAAVIDLAWQIFMFEPSQGRLVVAIDEPENHLHPELQRRVLTDLLTAFPDAQFIVATHSPFIVGSVPDSSVYVLAYDETKRVESHLLDTANRAGTANEILRDVLGLNSTFPVWVEHRLTDIVRRYAALEFSEANINSLRGEMTSLGMVSQIPDAIFEIANAKEQLQ